MDRPKLFDDAREAGVAAEAHYASFFLFWGLVMAVGGWATDEIGLWAPGLLFAVIGAWGSRDVLKVVSDAKPREHEKGDQ